MDYKKLNNILGWSVFAIATIVYLLTMEQTTSLWDCGEYITTANKLEVGHPPGAPFFMILGRLFSAFASPENAAMMINSMSALSSSFTILFLFWTITMLGRKLILKSEILTKQNTIGILGAGAVGALAYTFTDSFWFSAVEGEVYAMSSLFTAIVFWAILKWDVEVDKYNSAIKAEESFLGNPNRWILFISYMVGLSIGVHLLNLLAIPAIAFVIYFKKYSFTWKSFLITGITSLIVLAGIQDVIIPKTVSVADWIERLFVNSFGLPFNSGAFFFVLLLIVLIVLGIRYTTKKNKEIWNTIILSFALLLIGYSSFVVIVVRSNANTPLDENNPESLSQLHSYLKREQYGSWPILSGQYWNSPVYSDCDDNHLGPDKSSFMKVYSLQIEDSFVEIEAKDTSKVKDLLYPVNLHSVIRKSPNNNNKLILSLLESGNEITFMNLWELENYKERAHVVNKKIQELNLPSVISFSENIDTKYLNTLSEKRGEKKFVKEYTTIFPRMYRQGAGANYMAWCNYEGDENKPLPPNGQINQMLGTNLTDKEQQYERLIKIAYEKNTPTETRDYLSNIANNLQKEGLYVPSMAENLSYFFKYQIAWMYGRYFLWNFSGRQNDTQGYGLTGGKSDILEGNWMSGIDAIDNIRLGNQDNLPNNLKLNKGYNLYYMLPLILGLIGFFFHFKKHPKGWFTVFLLFLLTGLAIVIYLNQKPAEPRERDYAYAASFYAFSIWVGLGALALYDALKNISVAKLKTIALYSLGGSVAIFILQKLGGADLSLSYSLIYMSCVVLISYGFMMLIGKYLKESIYRAGIPALICLSVPMLLAFENWDDHDRSNRSPGRDFAYNYLMSCDYNAILFTNGDNDTFPLWYIQEVEGVRTDVRVANMSLLSTDWHINQMKKKAYESDPLPIGMSENLYRNGKRDYVIINEKENKKYKNNSLRLKKQAEFSKIVSRKDNIFNTISQSGKFNGLQISMLHKDLLIIDNYISLINSEKPLYNEKALTTQVLNQIKNINLTETQELEINNIKLQIEEISNSQLAYDQAQIQQLAQSLYQKFKTLSDKISKKIEDWPQKWYSAKEAIDFISDDRNRNFRSFSCNEEYFIDFINIYIPVDIKQAVKTGIINQKQAELPKTKPILKWKLKGGMLYKADLAVLSLLANYKWDRPIYFASIVGMQANQRLSKYMQGEGMTYKLTPIEFGGNGGTNSDKMLQLIKGDYELKKADSTTEKVKFLWGNMKEEGVLVDYYTMRMVQNVRLQLMKLSDELIAKNRKEDAISVLDSTFNFMPIENEQVPVDDICFYLCKNYYEAGDSIKGNRIAKILVNLELSKLEHYFSFRDEMFDRVFNEYGKALNNIEMLREASLMSHVSREEMFVPDTTSVMFDPVSFLPAGILEGTNYKEVFTKAKEKFNSYKKDKQRFFSNAQKFPVYYTQLWGGGGF